MNQIFKVPLDQEETRSVKTGRGVRQGCCLSPILFDLYSEYLTTEAFEGSGDVKIRQVFGTVKYTDDLVLPVKEETALQGTCARLIETGRCCGMEINVGEKEIIAAISNTYYDKSETTGECGILQIFG
jgi:hypothetical protein